MYPKSEEDFYDWAMYTTNLIKDGKIDQVDFHNILEELEALGNSEKRALINRLSLAICNLLQWQFQSERRGRVLRGLISEQRILAKQILEDSPSLKKKLKEIIEYSYRIGVLKALRLSELDMEIFPSECPYSFEQIMDEEFYPESEDK